MLVTQLFWVIVHSLKSCLYKPPSILFLAAFLASFRASLDLQKCQTKWQYVRYGKIADLNRTSLAFVGIKFLSVMITPILWLAFLQIELIWSVKLSLESIATPRRLRLSTDLISSLFTQIACAALFILTVANVHSLIFFEVSSKKIVIIPFSSSARTVP